MGTDDEERVNGEDGDSPFSDSFDDHECSCIEGDLPDGQGDDSYSEYNEEDIVLTLDIRALRDMTGSTGRLMAENTHRKMSTLRKTVVQQRLIKRIDEELTS